MGILQRALGRASPHIWFERAEAKDRSAVAQRLRQHVSDPKNPPILIFPEGTCINNTSVMQFKKGSFEVGGVIYPVAIKYVISSFVTFLELISNCLKIVDTIQDLEMLFGIALAIQ